MTTQPQPFYVVLAGSYSEAREWAVSQGLPARDIDSGRWRYAASVGQLRGLRDCVIKMLPGFHRRPGRDEILTAVREMAERGCLRIVKDTPKIRSRYAQDTLTAYPSLALAGVEVSLDNRDVIAETVAYEYCIACGYHACGNLWQHQSPHQICYSDCYELAGNEGWIIVRGKPACPYHSAADLDAMAKGEDDLRVMAIRAGKVTPP